MKRNIKQKGFIQIPLLAGIIIVVITSGLGVLLYRQDKAEIYEEQQKLITEEEQVKDSLGHISENSEQEETTPISSPRIIEIDSKPSKYIKSGYLEQEEIEMIKKEAERIEKELEKIKILAEEIKKLETEKEAEEDKVVDEEESEEITRENLFSILEKEINKRFQARKNDIQVIQSILDEYSQKIDDAKSLRDKAITSAQFCRPCGLLLMFMTTTTRCSYDLNRCNNLRQSHEAVIESLENQKELEVERNWPFWSSYQSSLDVPDIELFSIKDEIKTTDSVYSIEALPKLDGGYLIKFIDLDIEFEVIALADGSYYLKK